MDKSDTIAGELAGAPSARPADAAALAGQRSESPFRVAGLDSLRFIAALWVVFSHVGEPPIFKSLGKADAWGFLLNAAWGILFSGPAAVIVFFVISGFCIHYPYAAQPSLRVFPYFVRRYVRIGIPMVAAMAVVAFVGVDQAYFFHGILWSLVAELIYYTLYPAIRRMKSAFGMQRLVVASFLAALAVPLTAPPMQGYAMYGWQLNWLLGLPCWLLGVKLADQWRSRPADAQLTVPTPDVWKWRLYAWAASSFCLVLNYHSPVSYAWTLNVFALVAYAWISREILAANAGGHFSVHLERLGRWSYSLYLGHIPANAVFLLLGLGAVLPPAGQWVARMLFILVASYLFYVAVELPSHLAARRLSRLAARSGR